MRKLFSFIIFLFCSGILLAQMSDEQVVSYIKQAKSQGLSQQQIVTNLQKQGVTIDQARRIQTAYSTTSTTSSSTPATYYDRQRDFPQESTSNITIINPNDFSNSSQNAIFGHNIFSSKNLTFEPNMNIPTPTDYRLGPGDEIIIDIWGASQTSIKQTISPEGSIVVDKLGPIYLNGMTITKANAYLQQEFGKIYAVTGEDANSQIKISLGQTRTIQINIMGEVVFPGTFMLSSFSSVFHALYQAGGVNDLGTMRAIKVYRNGKEISSLDIYEYILEGKIENDIRLQDNDLIIVNPYENIVSISGKVKRPMRYEMTQEETIETLIKYAGGFTGDAYQDNLSLVRMSERERKIFTINKDVYANFKLEDGDRININSNLSRFENRVIIQGYVWRPGAYQLGDDITAVKQLIDKAEGLRGEAFLNRALLHREREDKTYEIMPIDLNKLYSGEIADIPLQNLDSLYISNIYDIKDRGTVSIFGEISRPGTFAFKENTTLSDLIVQAGGLLESASTAKIDVSRRLKDPSSQQETSEIGQTFTFAINDNFFIEGNPDFKLQPYDHVFVRRSPGYQPQQNVSIIGEVLFEGTYSLLSKNQRITELIKMAGGLTETAFVKGAYLIREMTSDEIARKNATKEMVQRQQSLDSIDVKSVDFSTTYYVGIDLEKAIASPGSDDDFVLQKGDRIVIPQFVSTVKIQGSVMYPNTILYNSDLTLKDCIEQSGGYAFRAKKNKAYIVYMNGTVAKVKQNKKGIVQPGCEIIVPSKPEKNRSSLTEMLSIATTATSLATMVATIANLFK
ncbi:MAG: SLBB domain-containing protein [Bacteroidales bacterium]|nr:SLBB domain-containing protein [Bacteroidales bacterium]